RAVAERGGIDLAHRGSDPGADHRVRPRVQPGRDAPPAPGAGGGSADDPRPGDAHLPGGGGVPIVDRDRPAAGRDARGLRANAAGGGQWITQRSASCRSGISSPGAYPCGGVLKTVRLIQRLLS
ncbi:MAG: hypothetical protein DRH24_19720, partial [Deltaproteobacteria bacterium]